MSQSVEDNTIKDLSLMCKLAEARNREHDITGLLIYDGKRFIQVIEGPVAAVRSLMKSIYNDKRHRKIVNVLDCSVDACQFNHWALASVGLHKHITNAQLLSEVKAIVSNVTNPVLKASFIGFARLAR